MIKIGLVGAGFMGRMHAKCYEALRERGGFEVVAVADLNTAQAAELAEPLGAAVFASAEEMMAQADINTVDICLPTFLHAELALQAMDKGMNLFIEKPVCRNSEEAARLLRKQEETGAAVMIGQCIRFWPEYTELRRIYEAGRYGKLTSAVFTRRSPHPDWVWEQWLDDEAKSGSAALDLHIHDVDYVRALLGEPQRISTELVRDRGANVHIHSLYRYGDVVVGLEGGWDYPPSFPLEMAFTVQFEQATVVFSSNAAPTLRVFTASGEVLEPELEQPDLSGAASGDSGGNISSLGGYYNELRYFIDRLSSGEPIAESTLADGCASLALLERALAAAER
ncbi:Gfo/Idh/MocA family oxidoreductase [Paenibacillus sp. IB182496]|uniref:Gfo/Idh/MocA family oxidoreductase n=1 Tax=Paenibacillus sabuli TaxID=2772509 RepID=A0A927BS59_9BACL|nr:Gfo/Idh/MocA family oxidoreductase [Paenibacillus sabuli]MBD2844760.1 Gfo/Idh/MocA family oxidoreductase [Paenibacillus sabuli]